MTWPKQAGRFARLDRGQEPWTGSLEGLGTVLVHADGRYEIEVDPEAVDGAALALEHGWAALLGQVRRGRALLMGSTMVAAARPGEALLVSGRVQEQAEICLDLAERGWCMLADTVTPADLTGPPVVAHPRGSPSLAPCHTRPDAVVTGRLLRAGGTAQVVPVEAAVEPATITARVVVVERGPRDHAGDTTVATVSGRRRLAAEYDVLAVRGPFDPPDPARALAQDLTVSRIPLGRLLWPSWRDRAENHRRSTMDDLVRWWDEARR